MKLSAPRLATFWVSVFLAVIGVILIVIKADGLVTLGLLAVVVAYVLLAFGNLTKGL